VQVELPSPATGGLIVELAVGARLRIESNGQAELAARLIQILNANASC
jgi:hypothetical protein